LLLSHVRANVATVERVVRLMSRYGRKKLEGRAAHA